MNDRNAKRQLTGLPSGKNVLANMQFSVRHFTPEVEEPREPRLEGFECFTAIHLLNLNVDNSVSTD